MENHQFIDGYLGEVSRIAQQASRDDIDKIIEILYQAWQQEKQVFVMGNGGSASTASHFAADLAKFTIAEGQKRFKVMGLTDNVPLMSAWTNDSGFGSIFVEQIRPWMDRGDVLVGFSVHGGSGEGDAGPWSQNLVQAMDLARDRGASIIGFSGFGGGAMKSMADACLVVPADREPLGTALVESFHICLHHLICARLKALIGGQG